MSGFSVKESDMIVISLFVKVYICGDLVLLFEEIIILKVFDLVL